MRKEFPKDFLWGSATSAFQVEGGIENMDWAKAAKEGKVPLIGRACDHYNRYESDFDLAKSLGHNCHRLSIEWSRIEPREGEFDMKEVEHYRNVLRALHARNMKPFVTLWHFTLPLWFSERGGFEQSDSAFYFARYCAYVVDKLKDLCDEFSTINEFMPYSSNGWLRGTWPPFKEWAPMHMAEIPAYGNLHNKKTTKSWFSIFTFLKVLKNLAKAHNRAYDEIKKVSGAQVGIVTHVLYFHANKNPINRLLAWIMNWHFTHRFMNKVKNKCDSIDLNYYIHKKFGDTKTYLKTDMGWDMYPEGIYGALMTLKRYNKPIYISEAGIADAEDKYRAEYIQTMVHATHDAIRDGVNVKGFMYWSLLDNYELALGYEKRFGLIEVNFETLERKIRPSALVYKKIIECNCVE